MSIARVTIALALALVLAPMTAAFADHDVVSQPPASPPPLFDNLGTLHRKVTTRVPKAQQYFDQGLRLTYAFNHDEAIRAFTEAARLDPALAMAHWGVALAYGPNINMPMEAEPAKRALEALRRARELAAQASPLERELIEALAARYSDDAARTRGALDTAYAEAMKRVNDRHPTDPDVATLYAEALMVLRPWRQWKKDGTPEPGTLDVIAALERALAKHPEHPGLNHFYIHVVEASPDPGRATAAADRLGKLVPGAGHLVHMPAHIYVRTGRYAEVGEVNRRAVEVDREYIAKHRPSGMYPMMYYPHNIHFVWMASCFEGRREEALKAVGELEQVITPGIVREVPMLEIALPVRLYTLARFGLWDEVLAYPAPDSAFRYTNAVWHYARGLALAARGRYAEAHAEREQIARLAKSFAPDYYISYNRAADLAAVASAALEGEILLREGRAKEAIPHLAEGVRLEDALVYDEPPTWYYPVRLSLGAAQLAAGDAAAAEQTYRKDLEYNPENGWALYGLAQALRALDKSGEAAEVEARLAKAWARADVKLASSRF